MSDVEVELEEAGFVELLTGPEITALCTEHAQNVLSAAGEGYSMEVKTSKDRVQATVRVETAHAYYSNIKHNTLVKALGGA